MAKKDEPEGCFTRNDFVGASGGDAEVVQRVAEVMRLAGSAAAGEDERLVAARRQHGPVRRLGRRVNVRRHVLGFAAAEQLDHLSTHPANNSVQRRPSLRQGLGEIPKERLKRNEIKKLG